MLSLSRRQWMRIRIPTSRRSSKRVVLSAAFFQRGCRGIWIDGLSGRDGRVCIPSWNVLPDFVFNQGFLCGLFSSASIPADKPYGGRSRRSRPGSTPEIAELVDNVYSSVIIAGTHRAPSIKVAEARRWSKTRSATSISRSLMSFRKSLKDRYRYERCD